MCVILHEFWYFGAILWLGFVVTLALRYILNSVLGRIRCSGNSSKMQIDHRGPQHQPLGEQTHLTKNVHSHLAFPPVRFQLKT